MRSITIHLASDSSPADYYEGIRAPRESRSTGPPVSRCDVWAAWHLTTPILRGLLSRGQRARPRLAASAPRAARQMSTFAFTTLAIASRASVKVCTTACNSTSMALPSLSSRCPWKRRTSYGQCSMCCALDEALSFGCPELALASHLAIESFCSGVMRRGRTPPLSARILDQGRARTLTRQSCLFTMLRVKRLEHPQWFSLAIVACS